MKDGGTLLFLLFLKSELFGHSREFAGNRWRDFIVPPVLEMHLGTRQPAADSVWRDFIVPPVLEIPIWRVSYVSVSSNGGTLLFLLFLKSPLPHRSYRAATDGGTLLFLLFLK